MIWWILQGLVVVLGAAGCAFLPLGSTDGQRAQLVEPAVVVEKICQTMRSLTSLEMSIRATFNEDRGLLAGSKRFESHVDLRTTMIRQDRFRVDAAKNGKPIVTILGDGTTMYEIDHSKRRYTKHDYGEQLGVKPRLMLLRNHGPPTPIATFVQSFVGSWIGQDSDFCGRQMQSIEDTKTNCKALEQPRSSGSSDLVLEASTTEQGRGMRAKATQRYAIDSNTGLPSRFDLRIKGTVLLFPQITRELSWVFDEVQADREIDESTFQVDIPPGYTFVPPLELMPPSTELTGKSAPQRPFRDLQGRDIQIGGPAEKPTLLVFWATWCAPCVRELHELGKLAQEDWMAQGVRILAVSIDASARDVRRFLKKSTVAFEVLHDPGGVVAGSEFLVHSVPHSFLIDRSGVIVRVWSGGGSDQLIGEIEAALREQVGD